MFSIDTHIYRSIETIKSTVTMRTTNALFIWMSCYAVGGPEQVVYFYPYKPPKDVKISTPTQHPTIPWSSLLRQRPRHCSTLQMTQQGWGNYQELFCGISPHTNETNLLLLC